MILLRLLSRIGRVSALPTILGGQPMNAAAAAGSSCTFGTTLTAAQVERSRGSRTATAWMATVSLLALGTSSTALAACQDDSNGKDDQGNSTTMTTAINVHHPFDESVLTYDHYNGVTLDLEKLNGDPSFSSMDPKSFSKRLEQALSFWQAEGRKGIWIHATTDQSHLVHACVEKGFSYHFVKNEKLILSRWLPDDVASKLPLGPTHQVGVGTVVFHPSDPSQMLVVQEKTGPAAALGLWKMPTGLLDPEEDIPDAAARELKEETGLDGTMEGIVCFRQAHSPSRTSDLFFVCRMELKDPNNIKWKPQEDEIADIRWMPVEEYCNQERWQGSPVYVSLNDSIRKASMAAQEKAGRSPSGMIIHEQLPLGFGRGTNALFKSQL